MWPKLDDIQRGNEEEEKYMEYGQRGRWAGEAIEQNLGWSLLIDSTDLERGGWGRERSVDAMEWGGGGGGEMVPMSVISSVAMAFKPGQRGAAQATPTQSLLLNLRYDAKKKEGGRGRKRMAVDLEIKIGIISYCVIVILYVVTMVWYHIISRLWAESNPTVTGVDPPCQPVCL